MSDRYQRVHLDTQWKYTQGAPVMLLAASLLKDTMNANERVLAQLKMCSLSRKHIKAVKVQVTPLDTVGRPLGEPQEYAYLDLDIARDEEFGQKTPLPMADAATRSITVAIVEVAFSDNSVWQSDAAWEPMEEPVPLASALGSSSLMEAYRNEYGRGACVLMKAEKDLWFCTCGRINHDDESVCHRCACHREQLESFHPEAFRQQEEERLKAQRALEEEQTLAAAAQKKKRGRVGGIVCLAILAVLIVVVAVFNKPIAYVAADVLFNAEQYAASQDVFEWLAESGYKDAADRAVLAEDRYLIALIREEGVDAAEGYLLSTNQSINRFVSSTNLAQEFLRGEWREVGDGLYYFAMEDDGSVRYNIPAAGGVGSYTINDGYFSFTVEYEDLEETRILWKFSVESVDTITISLHGMGQSYLLEREE